MYVCMYVCICICMYICMYVCMYVICGFLARITPEIIDPFEGCPLPQDSEGMYIPYPQTILTHTHMHTYTFTLSTAQSPTH